MSAKFTGNLGAVRMRRQGSNTPLSGPKVFCPAALIRKICYQLRSHRSFAMVDFNLCGPPNRALPGRIHQGMEVDGFFHTGEHCTSKPRCSSRFAFAQVGRY